VPNTCPMKSAARIAIATPRRFVRYDRLHRPRPQPAYPPRRYFLLVHTDRRHGRIGGRQHRPHHAGYTRPRRDRRHCGDCSAGRPARLNARCCASGAHPHGRRDVLVCAQVVAAGGLGTRCRQSTRRQLGSA